MNKVFPHDHATTKTCLKLMHYDIQQRQVDSVLDVGTGSGILSALALTVGVDFVVGLDICPDAIASARGYKNIHLVRGSTDCIVGKFDLVVANLPLDIAVELFPDLVRLCADDGTLVVGGFFAHKQQVIQRELEGFSFTRQAWIVEETPNNKWAAVIARREPDGR
jgi:ribosomal protein L11 methyltransferase